MGGSFVLPGQVACLAVAPGFVSSSMVWVEGQALVGLCLVPQDLALSPSHPCSRGPRQRWALVTLTYLVSVYRAGVQGPQFPFLGRRPVRGAVLV